jgi:hypothetical protein
MKGFIDIVDNMLMVVLILLALLLAVLTIMCYL